MDPLQISVILVQTQMSLITLIIANLMYQDTVGKLKVASTACALGHNQSNERYLCKSCGTPLRKRSPGN